MSPSAAPGRRTALAAGAGWAVLGALLLALLALALGTRLGRIPPLSPRQLSPADWIPAGAARLWPARGAAVANALLLAAAALLAARTLSRRLGGAAPVWVAAWVFGSVAFAYVFVPGGDLALLAATAAGFALVYLDESGTGSPRGGPLSDLYEGELTASETRFFARWCAAGALLALPGAARPLYLLLLLPAFLAPPPSRGRRARIAVAAGAAALLALAALVALGTGGWGWLDGLRPRPGLLDARLLGWNLLYFLAGRDLGVVPYFLPLLLCFAAPGGERGRRTILLAAVLIVLGLLLLRPFDFALAAGSPGPGNRAFLPLYAALWFLAARPARPAWAVAVAVLAAPFLHPLWRHPGIDLTAGGWPGRVSSVARQALPFETTQLLPGGAERVHDGLWTRLLSPEMGRIGEAESLKGDATGELLVGSREPLRALALPFDPRAPTRLLAGGRELRPSLLRPDGAVVFSVPLSRPRAVHPTAWSGGQDVHFYDLKLRLPGAPPVQIGFRALPQEELPGT